MYQFIIMLTITTVVSSNISHAETVKTSWGGNAEIAYDTGFMQMLKKHPAGGVSLFNMELVENDAPGSGYSEKGIDSDFVWGQYCARKIFNLDDPRAEKAWFVALFERELWFIPASEKSRKKPLLVTINGNSITYDDWGIDKSIITYRWFEFPAEWLKKGKNVIELACPDAASEEEGWEVWLARADEFEDGGGDPSHVGETSFKSFDGGKAGRKARSGRSKKTVPNIPSVSASTGISTQAGWKVRSSTSGKAIRRNLSYRCARFIRCGLLSMRKSRMEQK